MQKLHNLRTFEDIEQGSEAVEAATTEQGHSPMKATSNEIIQL